jgi:hypothetical protein
MSQQEISAQQHQLLRDPTDKDRFKNQKQHHQQLKNQDSNTEVFLNICATWILQMEDAEAKTETK